MALLVAMEVVGVAAVAVAEVSYSVTHMAAPAAVVAAVVRAASEELEEHLEADPLRYTYGTQA